MDERHSDVYTHKSRSVKLMVRLAHKHGLYSNMIFYFISHTEWGHGKISEINTMKARKTILISQKKSLFQGYLLKVIFETFS